jgi:hypothetical protein
VDHYEPVRAVLNQDRLTIDIPWTPGLGMYSEQTN